MDLKDLLIYMFVLSSIFGAGTIYLQHKKLIVVEEMAIERECGVRLPNNEFRWIRTDI